MRKAIARSEGSPVCRVRFRVTELSICEKWGSQSGVGCQNPSRKRSSMVEESEPTLKKESMPGGWPGIRY